MQLNLIICIKLIILLKLILSYIIPILMHTKWINDNKSNDAILQIMKNKLNLFFLSELKSIKIIHIFWNILLDHSLCISHTINNQIRIKLILCLTLNKNILLSQKWINCLIFFSIENRVWEKQLIIDTIWFMNLKSLNFG